MGRSRPVHTESSFLGHRKHGEQKRQLLRVLTLGHQGGAGHEADHKRIVDLFSLHTWESTATQQTVITMTETVNKENLIRAIQALERVMGVPLALDHQPPRWMVELSENEGFGPILTGLSKRELYDLIHGAMKVYYTMKELGFGHFKRTRLGELRITMPNVYELEFTNDIGPTPAEFYINRRLTEDEEQHLTELYSEAWINFSKGSNVLTFRHIVEEYLERLGILQETPHVYESQYIAPE